MCRHRGNLLYESGVLSIMSLILLLNLDIGINTSSSFHQDSEQNPEGRDLPKVATFHFPEYAYKETSTNEIIYHDFEVNCEQHPFCEGLEGVLQKACSRRCISYSCYQDIYAFDELEEGEIDVRLNSFKGCVIQRTGNTNRRSQHRVSRFQFDEFLHKMQWKLTNLLKHFA